MNNYSMNADENKMRTAGVQCALSGVILLGLEPRTHGLKGRCSTD